MRKIDEKIEEKDGEIESLFLLPRCSLFVFSLLPPPPFHSFSFRSLFFLPFIISFFFSFLGPRPSQRVRRKVIKIISFVASSKAERIKIDPHLNSLNASGCYCYCSVIVILILSMSFTFTSLMAKCFLYSFLLSFFCGCSRCCIIPLSFASFCVSKEEEIKKKQPEKNIEKCAV